MRLRSTPNLTPEQDALFANGCAPLELIECVDGFGDGERSRPATAAELEWVGQKWERVGDRWQIWTCDFAGANPALGFSQYDVRKATEGASL